MQALHASGASSVRCHLGSPLFLTMGHQYSPFAIDKRDNARKRRKEGHSQASTVDYEESIEHPWATEATLGEPPACWGERDAGVDEDTDGAVLRRAGPVRQAPGECQGHAAGGHRDCFWQVLGRLLKDGVVIPET